MLPKKLKHDSIVEALCEVRFNAPDLPELVVGQIADFTDWRDFKKSSTALSNMPAAIRRVDPNMRFEPIVQLQSPDGTRLVRIGEAVWSYHVVKTYCGWDRLAPELQSAINWLFKRIEGLEITRLGFRYVNALRSTLHHIQGVRSLDLSVRVGNFEVQNDVNLNFQTKADDNHLIMTRIASPSFVSGGKPNETTVVVDVDVFTPPGFTTTDPELVHSWVVKAHDFEKDAFFRLIPKDILSKLVED
jgi:uncharacterized protein (TIGR04255 family)